MIPEEIEFREECRSVFAEVAERFADRFSWRMLPRTAEEGGPTFRLYRHRDASEGDFVFPDTYRITHPTVDEMRDEARAFCTGFAYPDDE